MTDLDTRARKASAGLRERVSGTAMTLAVPPTERSTGAIVSHPAWTMAAGALAALVVLVGLWVVRPTVVADESEEFFVPTSVATTTTEASANTTTAERVAPVAPIPDSSTTSTAAEETFDTTPPTIEILNPVDGQVFEVKTIEFNGVTEPGARVFGGPYEAEVDADGNWSITLILSPGVNTATFVAIDSAGNEATATVAPVYEPPTTTTKPKEEVAAFKANFTFGECAEKPPYDVYYGKGEPGSTVRVISEFGNGETVVGANGEWELRVEFPEAPLGKVFSVKVKDSLGRHKYFEFVHTVG